MKIPLKKRLAELMPLIPPERRKVWFQAYLMADSRRILAAERHIAVEQLQVPDEQLAPQISAFEALLKKEGVSPGYAEDFIGWKKAEISRKRAAAGRRGGYKKAQNKKAGLAAKAQENQA